MSRVLPVLFNTDMVRAILDGRKTATRRLIKAPVLSKVEQPKKVTLKNGVANFEWNSPKTAGGFEIKMPYQPGDILYVRETIWQKIGYYLDVDGETKPSWYKEFKYVATDEKPETGWNYSWAKRPSIHMPKESARIWLKVKDVRVERLQEMTPDDAVREGTKETFPPLAVDEFRDIWNSTIKKSDLDRYGWDSNPYVWVIEFERCEKPETI